MRKGEAIGEVANFDSKFTHHLATVNGVRLHYVMGGQGSPVVLLHGYPETWYAWRKVMPALAENYTVIAPDLRGLGDSDKPGTGYDKRTVADDIYQLVRQLGKERIFLVGHDWGGVVGYAYAAVHQEDVRRFVFVESLLPGIGYEQAIAQESNWHHSFNITQDLAEVLVEGKERIFLAWLYRHYAYNPVAITASEIDEYVRCYAAPGGMRAGFEYYRTSHQDAQDIKANAKVKLTMPVLAIGGDRSIGDGVLLEMQQVAADVRGEVIKDCGHFVAEEQPDTLSQQIMAFLKKN